MDGWTEWNMYYISDADALQNQSSANELPCQAVVLNIYCS